MLWLRSYPPKYWTNLERVYITDPKTEHIYIENYDYTPLGKVQEDVCLLEWDMAVSYEDMRTFEQHAQRHPGRVIVAPYLLYSPRPVHFAHRLVYPADLKVVPSGYHERWVNEGDLTCDLFGFGMIYLPKQLIQEFLAAPAPARGRPPGVSVADYSDSRFTDQTFSSWYYRTQDLPVMVDWQVKPVHLHF